MLSRVVTGGGYFDSGPREPPASISDPWQQVIIKSPTRDGKSQAVRGKDSIEFFEFYHALVQECSVVPWK